MRRGSSSGPSDVTTNAISTFAASVCWSDVRPAACRTIALRRGTTERISPSPSPTQSPTATSTLSCSSRPGSRVRTAPVAVATSYAARCAATTRPGTRPGSSCSASSGFHPSAPRSNSGNAVSPSGRITRTARRPSPERSYARRAASRPRRPWRRNAQSSDEPPSAGDGNPIRLGAGHPAVKRDGAAELPRDVRYGEHAPPADEDPLVGGGQGREEPAAVRRPDKPTELDSCREHGPRLLAVEDEDCMALHDRELPLRRECRGAHAAQVERLRAPRTRREEDELPRGHEQEVRPVARPGEQARIGVAVCGAPRSEQPDAPVAADKCELPHVPRPPGRSNARPRGDACVT